VVIVEETSGDSWTVGGRAVFLITKTKIDPDVTVGENVKAEGILDNEGSLVTRENKSMGTD
jgi:hypothetical protein